MLMPEARLTRAVAEAEAEKLARDIFGVEATARRLPGEFDDNFHLKTCGEQDGSREFVLKVMHPARQREFVEMQCLALRHLADHAPELQLPRVLPSPRNERLVFSRIAGEERWVWMLTFVRGKTLAEVKPHEPELLRELGVFLGKMDRALRNFSHPAARRELKWDMQRTLWAKEHVDAIKGPARQALVQRFLWLFEREVVPALTKLRCGVIYGDANDYNVLVKVRAGEPPRIAGLVDFGDMHHGVISSELAIAAAYSILGKKNALAAAASVVGGYHQEFPLAEEELGLLYAMIGARLAVSVVNSALRAQDKPDDPYVTLSEAPAWEALERWAKVFPRFAYFVFRDACGMSAVRERDAVCDWLKKKSSGAAPLLDADLRTHPCVVLDLSYASLSLGADPKSTDRERLTEIVFGRMRDEGVAVGIGRYDEARPLYPGAHFGKGKNPTDERRTIHLGLDLFVEPGSAVRAPLDGVVELLANNALDGDYGPLVALRHETDAGQRFFTLYGHLTAATLGRLKVGQRIAHGEKFAEVGAPPENGDWAPHLHFQIILDLLDLGRDFPGVAYASESSVWKSLSPDPNLLIGIPEKRYPQAPKDAEATLAVRKDLLGANLSLSYAKPLKIVRGWRQYLYDETGRAFLDVYNNVPLVGHSHPRVTAAAARQITLLNTNTRYLHDNVVRYAERLTAKLPRELNVCYFLNSGSEANELALRLARAYTKSEDVIVLEHAYHGNTTTLIDVSPYKFDGPGGNGRKPWVHVAPIADDYRGPFRRGEAEAGKNYAALVEEIVGRIENEGRRPGAFLAETLPSVAGQIVFPPGYLKQVYALVRRAGGVSIADEVQVGFGRLGKQFWGFESQDVVPDIVVLGKPIGNAFPLGAVVTTRPIAESFANGMEFFSTFGGNPVACAAGLAVLDVLEEEGLQENALHVGEYLKYRLEELMARHELIGDVRGMGLFLGVDLVTNRATREPAPKQAGYVVNRLRERGILSGTDGPGHNVLKLRPPLIFSKEDAELFISTLDEVLGEDPANNAA